ncbi:excalibur calcium-binding domain-containing protein [Salinarimonas ramus]|nr:excalibur calcium-binding domain-containing protein [Salinarimonas ramus]
MLLAQRRTCSSARTCEEAVIMWCDGYRRADGDGDGIPCETVCRSRRQVDEIRRAIGC